MLTRLDAKNSKENEDRTGRTIPLFLGRGKKCHEEIIYRYIITYSVKPAFSIMA